MPELENDPDDQQCHTENRYGKAFYSGTGLENGFGWAFRVMVQCHGTADGVVGQLVLRRASRTSMSP